MQMLFGDKKPDIAILKRMPLQIKLIAIEKYEIDPETILKKGEINILNI